MPVAVVGDTQVEPDETFRVDLASPSGATLGDASATGTIVDDDAPSLARRELTHGASQWDDFAPPGADLFRLAQPPRASFEVAIDGASGDATPLLLERLAADNVTVLQSGTSSGTGGATALRWENTSSLAVGNQHVRVTASCGAACGTDDAYRVRAWETTLAGPRFNNGGGQATVVLLANQAATPVAGHVWFWNAAGALLASSPFTLDPRQSLVAQRVHAAGPGRPERQPDGLAHGRARHAHRQGGRAGARDRLQLRHAADAAPALIAATARRTRRPRSDLSAARTVGRHPGRVA